ncbi:MAG: hypothetical protein LIO69_06650, partial [Oscillospiraceae bacterium]|nr:hypothetical protein [Oscillospiraceae bacterium]
KKKKKKKKKTDNTVIMRYCLFFGVNGFSICELQLKPFSGGELPIDFYVKMYYNCSIRFPEFYDCKAADLFRISVSPCGVGLLYFWEKS